MLMKYLFETFVIQIGTLNKLKLKIFIFIFLSIVKANL